MKIYIYIRLHDITDVNSAFWVSVRIIWINRFLIWANKTETIKIKSRISRCCKVGLECDLLELYVTMGTDAKMKNRTQQKSRSKQSVLQIMCRLYILCCRTTVVICWCRVANGINIILHIHNAIKVIDILHLGALNGEIIDAFSFNDCCGLLSCYSIM